jgi:hypothetical protein
MLRGSAKFKGRAGKPRLLRVSRTCLDQATRTCRTKAR